MLMDWNLTLEIKLQFSIPERRIAAAGVIAEDQELGKGNSNFILLFCK